MSPAPFTLPPGWTLDIYEREDGVWLTLIGPDHQRTSFPPDSHLIRAQILREYISARRDALEICT